MVGKKNIIIQFIETESKIVLARGGGRGKWGIV